MKNTLFFVGILILIAVLSSCKATKYGSAGGEDYESFYLRFHNDSLFQMSRVIDPLPGMKIEGSKISNWDRSEWSMHKNGKHNIDQSIYPIVVQEVYGRVIERLHAPHSTILIERHFERVEGKWMLVYCLDFFL